MFFDWDDRKATHNLQKHQVSFEEASTVFAAVRALTFDDRTIRLMNCGLLPLASPSGAVYDVLHIPTVAK